MRFGKLLASFGALTLAVAPTMASAANPAAPLSVAPAAARASTYKGDSNLSGGGLWAVLALGAVIVAAIVIGSNGGGSSSP